MNAGYAGPGIMAQSMNRHSFTQTPAAKAAERQARWTAVFGNSHFPFGRHAR
jgi:hypothetical protein